MIEQVTCHWGTLTALQRKHQILTAVEAYAQSLRELTGKDVRLSLSFGHHPNCEDGVAVFTIEAEL